MCWEVSALLVSLKVSTAIQAHMYRFIIITGTMIQAVIASVSREAKRQQRVQQRAEHLT
jgi:hypothetical protein